MDTKNVIILAIVMMVIGTTVVGTTIGTVKASIAGDYSQGRQDGRDQARQDFPSFNNNCHNTISYCAGYEVAYGKMWSDLNEVNKN